MALDTTPLVITPVFGNVLYPPQTGTTVESQDVAQSVQDLGNSVQYLKNLGRLIAVDAAMNLTTPGTTLYTIPAGGYSAIVGPATTVEDAEATDKILVEATMLGEYTGPTYASIRFIVTQDYGGTNVASVMPFGFIYYPAGSVDRRETNLIYFSLSVAGDVQVTMEGQADTNPLLLTTQVHLRLSLFRPKVP